MVDTNACQTSCFNVILHYAFYVLPTLSLVGARMLRWAWCMNWYNWSNLFTFFEILHLVHGILLIRYTRNQ